MTKHNIAITLLIALGVTACSGGSSSHTEIKQIEEVPSILSADTITIIEGANRGNDKSDSTDSSDSTTNTVDNAGNANDDNANADNAGNANDGSANADNAGNANEDSANTNETNSNGNTDTGNDENTSNDTPPNPTTDKPTADNNNQSGGENQTPPNADNNTDVEPVYFKDNAKYVSATWHTSPEGIMYADHWNTDNADGYNHIKIGDTWIELFPAGVQSKALNQKSAQQIKYLTRGDYTLSGIAQFNDIEGQPFYVISQGKNPTQDMPTAGTFLYQGKGQHAELENNNLDFNRSDLTFEADFANKSLTGTVSSPDNIFPTRNLKADMTKQNAFSGVSDGIELRGGFYGSNAAEMTGQYHRNIETENGKELIMGVFNATKQ